MYVQLNCAIIDPDETNRQELAAFLGRMGVHVVCQLPTGEQLPALLGRTDAPQLVLANLDPGAHDNLRKISHLPRQYPNISFFLMSQVLDANLLMEAMHLGVKEFIPASDERGQALVGGGTGCPEHGDGQTGADHPRGPDDRRMRIDDSRLQRRRFAGQEWQDRAG